MRIINFKSQFSVFIFAFFCIWTLTPKSNLTFADVIKNQATAGRTVDGIEYGFLELKYLTQPVDITFPYDEEGDDQFAWGASTKIDSRNLNGFRITAYTAKALITKKWDDRFQLNATAGGDYSLSTGQEAYTGFNSSLEWIGLLLDRNLIYSILAQHGLAIPNAGFQDRRSPSLRSTEGQVVLDYQFAPRYRFYSMGNFGYLTDRNIRRSGDFAVLYGVALEDPVLWVGMGAEITSFTERSSQYWSPTRFKGIGPRMDLSGSIGHDWTYSVAGNITRLQEDDFNWEYGSYSSIGMQYGSRDLSYLSLNWNHIRSIQVNTPWHQNELVLTWNLYF